MYGWNCKFTIYLNTQKMKKETKKKKTPTQQMQVDEIKLKYIKKNYYSCLISGGFQSLWQDTMIEKKEDLQLFGFSNLQDLD